MRTHLLGAAASLLLHTASAEAQQPFGAPSPAQEPAPQPIPKPLDRPVVRYTPGQPNSDRALAAGNEIRMVGGDSVIAGASLTGTDNPLRVWVLVENSRGEPFDLYPDSLELLSDDSLPEALEFLSAAKLAKKIENDAKWSAALLGFAHGLSGNRVSRTSGSVSSVGPGGYTTGTYSATTRTYDATASLAQTNAILQTAEAEKIRATTGALLANTVRPGATVEGYVFFKRRKFPRYLLRVRLPRVILEIPLEAQAS